MGLILANWSAVRPSFSDSTLRYWSTPVKLPEGWLGCSWFGDAGCCWAETTVIRHKLVKRINCINFIASHLLSAFKKRWMEAFASTFLLIAAEQPDGETLGKGDWPNDGKDARRPAIFQHSDGPASTERISPVAGKQRMTGYLRVGQTTFLHYQE